jgi:hypothetical protein
MSCILREGQKAKLGGNAEVHGFRPREDETVDNFID